MTRLSTRRESHSAFHITSISRDGFFTDLLLLRVVVLQGGILCVSLEVFGVIFSASFCGVLMFAAGPVGVAGWSSSGRGISADRLRLILPC